MKVLIFICAVVALCTFTLANPIDIDMGDRTATVEIRTNNNAVQSGGIWGNPYFLSFVESLGGLVGVTLTVPIKPE